MISQQEIQAAHERVKPYIHNTPIISSSSISEMFKCQKFSLKCQNLQKVGAFKVRGVFNKMLQLDKSIKKTVCTQSSGNNAAALAFAAKQIGLQAKIVMPENSPEIKKKAVEGYGAEIFLSENKVQDRQQKCQQIQTKYQATLFHPYNDIQIITGQATCAKEIFECSQQQYDYIVCPIGGGGLMSGTLLSCKYFGKGSKIIGAEPYLARDAYDSLKTGSIQPQYPPISIADGLRVPLGTNTFKIINEHLPVDDLILVTQEQIIQATRLIMERMKLVIEPSSATTVAAVAKDKRFVGKKVCCIITGGNVDLACLEKAFLQKIAANQKKSE